MDIVICSLFHESPLVFLRGCPWYLAIFSYECRFKLFNLLIVFDKFTFDLWYLLFLALGYVLLLGLVRYFAAVKGCAGDFGSALQLRWQVSVLNLLELVLDLLLLLLSDRSTIVIVVDILLR